MRRLVALVVVGVLVPATAVSAQSLEELLERSRDASYSAQQLISCSTPDGARDAVVRIAQSAGEMRLAAAVNEEVEVAAGSGAWTLSRSGGVVSSAALAPGRDSQEPLYLIEEIGDRRVLGRPASAHRLIRDEVIRAELVFDDETGALLWATTFTADGEIYCDRRFVSFDPTNPNLEPPAPGPLDSGLSAPIQDVVIVDAALPESAAGFDRLDLYEDADGFRFAYYSDGFFSFAVFETPTAVALSDASSVKLDQGVYMRSFTAGQATYVWETRDGGMALLGDLPPDLHEAVLGELPAPETPGLFRRIWRSLFG